jgi:hypothetical protein
MNLARPRLFALLLGSLGVLAFLTEVAATQFDWSCRESAAILDDPNADPLLFGYVTGTAVGSAGMLGNLLCFVGDSRCRCLREATDTDGRIALFFDRVRSIVKSCAASAPNRNLSGISQQAVLEVCASDPPPPPPPPPPSCPPFPACATAPFSAVCVDGLGELEVGAIVQAFPGLAQFQVPGQVSFISNGANVSGPASGGLRIAEFGMNGTKGGGVCHEAGNPMFRETGGLIEIEILIGAPCSGYVTGSWVGRVRRASDGVTCGIGGQFKNPR